MLKLFNKIRRTPIATEPFGAGFMPQAPAGIRGFPELLPGGDPAAAVLACPSGALAGGTRGEVLDLGLCHQCGACAETAPGAVLQGTRYALATRDRASIISEVEPGELCEPEFPAAASAGEIDAEIRSVLGRSLHLRHVDSGSCNACDWELTHLLNPVYDLQRFGIDFVASPRHADLLVVTGGVTRHLEAAVKRTYEAAGDPKLVMAVGTCATSGGMIGANYARRGGVDHVLPVAVYVPGCPPRPEAILEGILLAVGRVQDRD